MAGEKQTTRALQPSKMVVERQKLADKVVAALETHATHVGAGIAREFEGLAARGEHTPDMALATLFAARRLVHLRDAMVECDLANQRELSDDAEPRARRDKSDEALRATLRETAEMALGLYGPAVFPAFKLGGALPVDSSALVTFSREAARAIADANDGDLPAPRIRGARVNRGEWAEAVNAAAEALATALADVTRESREAEVTLSAKNRAIESFDVHFRRSIALLEALLSYAGEQSLADKVRPSLRGSATSADESSAPGTSGSGSAPSTPASGPPQP